MANLEIWNTIIWQNQAAGLERRIYSNAFGDYSIYNSIIDGEIIDGLIELPENNIEATANIEADPSFVAPGSGDFHLQPTSPAINMGFPDVVPGEMFVDIYGSSRIYGASVDVGAAEYSE